MSEKIKIIYIDDEKINVMLFQINFSVNYEVYTGYSGYEGLNLLEKHSDTKAVISDLSMPEMSGIEFIMEAKKKYPEKKFYILTGFEVTDEIENAIKSGLIQGYFRKPFCMQEIEKEINKLS
ncbi:response regulator [Psychroflexus sediminis]|uniref:CheY chemotaxis protein or a CheY-like REC (Receiver) domain n=1 Tax=Psychroflexus sediminis TaxID=470826 RepID=A0A1G7XCM2_9FLAO|nr:response regulator [Psychroflexus sediminis]SDG81978.1 CheY chemotaxis protein or a CheY-like REC (receiver) domain [Psychroflexus sediminis]